MVWMKTCSRKQVLHERSLRPQWIQYSVRLMENYHSGVCWLSLSLTVTIVTWSPMTTSVPSPQGVMRLSLWKLYLNKHCYMSHFPFKTIKKTLLFDSLSAFMFWYLLYPLDDCVGKNSLDVSDQIRSIATEAIHIGLSCQCAALPVIFFLCLQRLLILTPLSLACTKLAVLSPSFYKGVKGRFLPLGKGIFQFKYGLFIELPRQGWALMYFLCHRAMRLLHVPNTWPCMNFKDATGLHSYKWIFHAFLFYLRDLCQLSKTLIDGEVHY